MLVVIIITITATLASPVFIYWRDRHGRQAAIQVAQTYSDARMLAMASGAAVMVRWNSATGFTVVQAIEGVAAATARQKATCAEQPGLGCLSNDWTANSRVVHEYKTANAVSIEGKTGAGAAMTQMNVCFTPLGRSFASFDGAPPTAPMVSTPTFDVRRMDKTGGTFAAAGRTRSVVILPNGMARLAL